MRNSIGILAAVLFLGLTASIANAAESKAVQTMAGILMNLHHYPSDSDKQALVQITEDKSATADERTVAQALKNVQHTVAAADKPISRPSSTMTRQPVRSRRLQVSFSICTTWRLTVTRRSCRF